VAEAVVGGTGAGEGAAPARSWADVKAAVREREQGSLRRLGELSALTGFALVQPVLDVTGRAPEFFLYRHPHTWQIRLLLALVVLAPALGMWAAELVAGLFGKVAAKALHLAFVALLFGIIAVEVGKHAHLLHGTPLVVVATLTGIGLATLAVRQAGLRQAILYAAPAPLIFALVFVATSPAGVLVRASKTTVGTRIAPPPNDPPIVFIFLDEFPQRDLLDAHGQIDGTLFPNFARLASLTTWFPNATGVSGWTPFAAPAMLSGRYPQHAVAAHYLAYPQNLFTMLAGSYQLRVFETISELCPPQLCTEGGIGRPTGLYPMLHDTAHIAKQIVSPNPQKGDLTQEFTEGVDVTSKPVTDPSKLPNAQFLFDRAALNQPNRFTEFVKGLTPSDKPTLHFLHLLLPHAPWRYLPSEKQYVPSSPSFVATTPRDDPKRKHLSMDPVLSVLGKQRQLLQLAYTDHLIGVLLDKLEKTGLFDKSLLIVTADHGSGLTPGAKPRRNDAHNPADLDWIPLFVKVPGQHEGKVDNRNEQQVDLMPTIADVLGVQIPWKVDGVSVLGPPRTTEDKLWYDDPGTAEHIPLSFREKVKFGLSAEVARPELGRDGLFAVGPYKSLYGKRLSSFTVGAPSPVRAVMDKHVDVDRVNLKSGTVPAELYGVLDGAVAKESTWLVASVNGTVAGLVPAVLGGDGWRFLGMVNDKYFHDGRNDVRLYTVSGTTLHPLQWQ
jgi:hypothetical protein